MTLPDLHAAIRWFAPLWYDRDFPTRLHVHDVEPDSILGSPKLAPKFLAYLAASASDVTTVNETRTCRHPRLDRDASAWECPDCGGAGVYLAERRLFRDPIAAAIENLRRHPAPWPRGQIPAAALVVELAGCGFRLPVLAERLGMRVEVLAEFALLALRQVRSRYLDGPPTSVSWIDKSDAQRGAELAGTAA